MGAPKLLRAQHEYDNRRTQPKPQHGRKRVAFVLKSGQIARPGEDIVEQEPGTAKSKSTKREKARKRRFVRGFVCALMLCAWLRGAQ